MSINVTCKQRFDGDRDRLLDITASINITEAAVSKDLVERLREANHAIVDRFAEEFIKEHGDEIRQHLDLPSIIRRVREAIGDNLLRELFEKRK